MLSDVRSNTWDNLHSEMLIMDRKQLIKGLEKILMDNMQEKKLTPEQAKKMSEEAAKLSADFVKACDGKSIVVVMAGLSGAVRYMLNHTGISPEEFMISLTERKDEL